MSPDQLLIIGKVWPEPASSAAGSRMLALIDLVQKAGYRITFATAAAESEFAADLESIDVRCEAIELNNSSFNHFIRELDPAVVLFDRFMTEEQYGWRVAEECPGAVRILDTEDLHALRTARQHAWNNGREFKVDDLFDEEIARREIASICRCDLSLIISDYEYNLLTDQFRIDESLLFYLPFLLEEPEDTSTEPTPGYEGRGGFVSIGNFLHEPNWNAVLWLKEEIWPIIRNELPKTELNIYGAYPSQKVFQLNNPGEGFRVCGRADSAGEVIGHSKVLLAPLRFGAGLKGKLVDAMRFGTPSVTTSIGAEGVAGEGNWCGEVANDPVDFAQAAVLLHQNQNRWREAQNRGVEIIREKFMKPDFEQPFLNRLDDLLQNLQAHRRRNFVGSMMMHHTQLSARYLSKWIEEKNR